MIDVKQILRRVEAAGVPKSRVAKQAGIDPSNFTRWADGKTASQESLQKVQDVLDTNYPLTIEKPMIFDLPGSSYDHVIQILKQAKSQIEKQLEELEAMKNNNQ